jgi:hypothetical protein
MSLRRIKTTVPQRTLGSKAQKLKLHSVYLRMSHLAMERLRRETEIQNLKARLELLDKRVAAIDAELVKLRELAAQGTPMHPDAVDDEQAILGGPGLAIRY